MHSDTRSRTLVRWHASLISITIAALPVLASAPAAMAQPAPPPARDPELDELRKAATRKAGGDEEKRSSSPPAASASILNPEISATADMLVRYRDGALPDGEEGGFRFEFRELELDVRANLDPYSHLRTAVAFRPEGVELEEAWFEWAGLIPHVTLKVGRFRQRLGTVNRWHLHAWDQLDLPLVMSEMLGDEGLGQTGLALDVLFGGFGDSAHTLTVEVTNSENEALFGDEAWRLPTVLGRFGTHVPVGGGYVEVGLGALHGYHDDDPKRFTNVYFADLSGAYDPPGGPDRFRLFFRAQWMMEHRDVDGGDTFRQGAFAYLDLRFDRRWAAGVRGDWLTGTTTDVAGGLDDATYGVAPYVALWQSEYVRIRLQYRLRVVGSGVASTIDHLAALQITGAIGPHRHERY